MKNLWLRFSFLFLLMIPFPLMARSRSENPAAPLRLNAAEHTFVVHDGKFLLDGKPFQVISGEMHYQRIPREYWRERFRMAKAMGLNAVTTYVFWNVHEPRPGVYDFSGNNDVAEFVREAQQEGLWVVLRPGPYACAEWEFGGYPAWLLKDHSIVLRSSDPKFIEPARRWIKRLGEEVASLQIGNGGPVLLVQVENEYGSFGSDHAYMEQIHKMLVDAGFTKSVLYTADGAAQVPAGSLPELPVGINFGGSDNAQHEFEMLKKYRPNGPFFNSEFWDGWFDHWGSKHAGSNLAKESANLEWMLKQGYSVSVYMFHGGTSFGWMNGANWDRNQYFPDVTSYDYDAALNESGRPTKKYAAFREVIMKSTGATPPAVPSTPPTQKIAEFKLEEAVSLWDVLRAPVESEQVQSMEDIDQAYGYILYRTKLKKETDRELVLEDLHDYAQVYVDGKLAGTLDRRLKQNKLGLKAAAGARLDILVENTGRINFSEELRGERKGITKQVTLGGEPLLGWEIYTLPMTDVAKLPFKPAKCEGACFYRGTLSADKQLDTFLDTSAFTKGQVWLNGRAMGRVWDIGPQKTLYFPGPWLKQGANQVIVFDLQGMPGRSLFGRDEPILNSTR